MGTSPKYIYIYNGAKRLVPREFFRKYLFGHGSAESTYHYFGFLEFDMGHMLVLSARQSI